MLMPWRSAPLLPPTIFQVKMWSRRPSGNMPANIVIFHSGSTAAAISRSPAPSTVSRARGESSVFSHSVSRISHPAGGGPAPARLHQEVPLHLLVHRGAEVGAVEWPDAGLGGPERDGLRLARVHD